MDSGITQTSDPPWKVCRMCGTSYRFETKMIERNIPEETPEEEKPKKLENYTEISEIISELEKDPEWHQRLEMAREKVRGIYKKL